MYTKLFRYQYLQPWL